MANIFYGFDPVQGVPTQCHTLLMVTWSLLRELLAIFLYSDLYTIGRFDTIDNKVLYQLKQRRECRKKKTFFPVLTIKTLAA